MKNFRFWLTTEVAACFLVALAPAQAETVRLSDTFSNDFATAIASRDIDSQDWESFEENSAKSLKETVQMETLSTSLKLAQAKSVVKPEAKSTGLKSLVKELEVLSNPLALNFPEPNQISVAQMAPPSRPMPPPPAGSGQPMFPNPEIIIQQQGVVPQSGSNPGNPSILSPAVPVAPVRSRAVPPPVGDLAISNINASFDMIDLGQRGQVNVPSLVLREAPAREVLAVLTRYAGMNLIFTDRQNNEGTATPGTPPAGQVTPPQAQSTITLDVQDESVQDVFNYVLMASGLKASRRGNTIFAGASLLPSARNLITRTIRINQAKAESVASTLASQGAEVNILFEGQEDVQLAQNAPPRVIKQPPTLVPLTVQKPANDSSVLILEGLVVSTDPRLNTVTLVGEPRTVELASSMITQMDARRRQVAVNVKIVDVNLGNIQDYNSSFSFGIGDSYFVQDNGAAVMRFGNGAPANQDALNSPTGRISNPPAIPNPFQDGNTFIDPTSRTGFINTTGQRIFNDQGGTGSSVTDIMQEQFFFNRRPGVSTNPFEVGILQIDEGTPSLTTINRSVEEIAKQQLARDIFGNPLIQDSANTFGNISPVLGPNGSVLGVTPLGQLIDGSALGNFVSVLGPDGTPVLVPLSRLSSLSTEGTLPTISETGLPSFYQYPKNFQAEIFAQIRSGNAKILTDPTLVVQEGESAQVKLTESVVASVNTEVDTQGDTATRTITPVLEDVGLTLNVIVDKIDDNGFITLRVNPIVASPAEQVRFDSGAGAVNEITLINKRELTSGVVRLRDDQTFILSGIISEIQQSTTTKVPILGDLPIIGALFRSSSDRTDRSEVIIMLTPKIIADSTETQFGFRYNPDPATAELLRQKGFPVQAQP